MLQAVSSVSAVTKYIAASSRAGRQQATREPDSRGQTAPSMLSRQAAGDSPLEGQLNSAYRHGIDWQARIAYLEDVPDYPTGSQSAAARVPGHGSTRLIPVRALENTYTVATHDAAAPQVSSSFLLGLTLPGTLCNLRQLLTASVVRQ